MKKPGGFRRSPCPIASTLDLVGDKWSLLVVRDMLRGKSTYGELLGSPEGIPTNILADRLKRLQESGIIVKSVYQERPARFAYRLSEKGAALGNILAAFVQWGKKHIPNTRTLSETEPDPGRGRSTRRSSRTRAGAMDGG
jgi:DNA-binding HxlR family transcriptional regulator